jgi:hypothetical protein
LGRFAEWARKPITDAELAALRGRLDHHRGTRIGRGVVRSVLARLADAEGEGCTLHGDAPHGKEAEELRKGIEEALTYGTHAEIRDHLSELLDRVDARDSLAHLRANERIAELEKRLAALKPFELRTLEREVYDAMLRAPKLSYNEAMLTGALARALGEEADHG